MFTAENSAKQGDDMFTILLFTAKFSAKQGDDRVVNTPLKLIFVGFVIKLQFVLALQHAKTWQFRPKFTAELNFY